MSDTDDGVLPTGEEGAYDDEHDEADAPGKHHGRIQELRPRTRPERHPAAEVDLGRARLEADEPAPGIHMAPGDDGPQRTLFSIERHEHTSGLIPPPSMMEGYQRVDPTLPSRFVRMAEKDQDFEIEQSRAMLAATIDYRKRGQTIAAAITAFSLVAAVVLLFVGQNVGAGIMLSMTLVLLVRSFLTDRHPRRSQPNPGDDVSGDT